MIKCGGCGGTGTCSSCQGTGIKTYICSQCLGREPIGIFSAIALIDCKCGGSGLEYLNCNRCGGNTICPGCGGSGYISDESTTKNINVNTKHTRRNE